MGRTIDDVFNCLAAFIESQIERDMGNDAKSKQAVESDAKEIKVISEGVNQLTSMQENIESTEATFHQKEKNQHRIKRNRAGKIVTSENIPSKSFIESLIIPIQSCSQLNSYLAACLDTGQLSSSFNDSVLKICDYFET